MWKRPLQSLTLLILDIKQQAPSHPMMIEAAYASPRTPDKQQEKEASGYSRTSECTLMYAQTHTQWTNVKQTHNRQR